MHFRRGGLCAAIVLVAAASARADDRTLVLVSGRAGAGLANRLRAEAANVGIVMVGDEGASLDEEPASVCQRNRAIGLLRVWSDTKVALFLPATGRASAPVETFQVSAEARDSLALRIIEEIRSRLAAAPHDSPQKPAPPTPHETADDTAALQGESDTPPARPPSPGPSPAEGAERPSALVSRPGDVPTAVGTGSVGGGVSLAGGVAGTFSPGGLGPTLQAAVAIAARHSTGFGLALRAAFPLLTGDLTAREGTVRWQPVLATIEATAEPWRRPDWSVILGAEAGAMFINLSPSAAPDYQANPDRMVMAVFLVGAGVRARLNDWLAARAGFSVGVAAPRPVVRIDGRDVAHWGRPCVFVTLATELRLFDLRRGATQP